VTLAELRRRVLERLSERMAPAGFRRRDQSFWKDAGPVALSLHVSFINHADDFDLTADVAVRHHAVEDILNAARRLSARDMRTTATVGAELGNLAGVGQHRWTVTAEADVDPAIDGVADWFRRIGEPFLQRFSSPAEALRVLDEDGIEARLICPIAATRSQVREILRQLHHG